MIITFNTKPNRAAVAFVAYGMKRSPTLPILSQIRVGGNEEEVTLLSTNLDQFLACILEVGADGNHTHPVCLPGKRLAEMVRTGEHIYLSSNGDKAEVNVDTNHFTLPQMKAEEFPMLPQFEPEHTFTMPAAVLARGLRLVQDGASTDDSRYVLNGILFEVGAKELTLVATDGKRMHITDIPWPKPVLKAPAMGQRKMITDDAPTPKVKAQPIATQGQEIKFTLPNSSVRHLHRLLKAQPEAEPVTIESKEKSVVRFTGHRLLLQSKLVDGTYPHYQQLIPNQSTFKATFTIAPSSWVNALRTVQPYTKDIKGSENNSVMLHVSTYRINFRVFSTEHGGCTQATPCDYSGPNYISKWNVQYLIDALTPHLNASYPVRFHYCGEHDPCLITTPTTKTIIMPIRMH